MYEYGWEYWTDQNGKRWHITELESDRLITALNSLLPDDNKPDAHFWEHIAQQSHGYRALLFEVCSRQLHYHFPGLYDWHQSHILWEFWDAQRWLDIQRQPTTIVEYAVNRVIQALF